MKKMIMMLTIGVFMISALGMLHAAQKTELDMAKTNQNIIIKDIIKDHEGCPDPRKIWPEC